MDLGSWAEWANACAATLAFLGAAVAAVISLRAYRLQQEDTARELARSRTEERYRQANRVAAWLNYDGADWVVRLVNSSDLPVYRSTLRVLAPGIDERVDRSTLGPCRERRSEALTKAVQRILDGPDRDFFVLCFSDGAAADAETVVAYRDSTRTMARVGVEIEFTDGAGVRWRRDMRGGLHEVG